jgi:CRP-like cAMP-binding protein
MVAAMLKQALDPVYAFPLHMWESLTDLGEIVIVPKDTILKKCDSTEKYLYFVLKGSGGVLLWHNSNYICTDLVWEGDFLCDYLSLVIQQPTPYEVITFDNTELFRISYQHFQKFTEQSEYGDKLWRYSLQLLYVEKHVQQLNMVTHTAAEMYETILKHQPEMIQKIPLKYLASYLGITPQSLSRIRKTLSI